MKVEIDGKTYCVETLIFDNKRLRKEVVEGAKLHRLVLDKIRAEIEEEYHDVLAEDIPYAEGLERALIIIGKYRNEVSE